MGKSISKHAPDPEAAEPVPARNTMPARSATESDPVEEFRRRAEAYNRLYMATPEQARETLHRIGILTKSGKVAKNYK